MRVFPLPRGMRDTNNPFRDLSHHDAKKSRTPNHPTLSRLPRIRRPQQKRKCIHTTRDDGLCEPR